MSNYANQVIKLAPLPLDHNLTGEELERWEKNWHEHKQVWGEMLQENADRMKKGTYSLHWMNTDGSSWGRRAKPSSRGLTYQDLSRMPSDGEIPEQVSWRNLAPRGSIREPYANRMPVIEEYDVLSRDEVWADNVVALYEEAKARQWNATRDIPWSELKALPEDLEKAMCQLCTFLTEAEFVAGDFPARWIYRMPQDFLEVKAFLATQLVDEARHLEVFRKRAMAGGGLLHAGPAFEWAIKAILESPTHAMGTFLLNSLAEGLVLSMFRFGEVVARTHVDKEIFRLAMQDEARHVSYGVLQLKTYLDGAKDEAIKHKRIEELHRFADLGEQIILTAFSESQLLEPLAILLGGGVAKLDQGMDGVAKMWEVFMSEYLQRCKRSGFDRTERCKMPLKFPWGGGA
ncbi:MAG TPA: hypothetical protein VEY88_25695 [Archangium sp.]|nr:hypothetical protein [Archangium sp.]